MTLVLVASIATPAAAELVAFTDGRVLKAEDAFLEGAKIVIKLRGGGTMRVPATRVERVIADEVDDVPENVPDIDCPWRWSDAQLPDALPFRNQIAEAARGAGLHPWLLAAVVQTESAFDPAAVSRAGAAGLTQLMPATAADRGIADVFDPTENLRGGAAHLRVLLDRYHTLTLALAAYNAGPATVDRFGGIPPYRETRRYVRKITGLFCANGH